MNLNKVRMGKKKTIKGMWEFFEEFYEVGFPKHSSGSWNLDP